MDTKFASAKWRDKDGAIFISVTSDGTSGPQWIERLEKKGFRLSYSAKNTLNSPDFKPTKGVTSEITILRGTLFGDADRTTDNILLLATQTKLVKPNPEVACLIRENISDEDMEAMDLIWVVVMHEPIDKSRVSGTSLLVARRNDFPRCLHAWSGGGAPDGWPSHGGFAFAIEQTTTTNPRSTN